MKKFFQKVGTFLFRIFSARAGIDPYPERRTIDHILGDEKLARQMSEVQRMMDEQKRRARTKAKTANRFRNRTNRNASGRGGRRRTHTKSKFRDDGIVASVVVASSTSSSSSDCSGGD